MSYFLDPYVLVSTTAVLTSLVLAAYAKYTDQENVTKTLWKHLLVSIIIGVAFVFIVNRPEGMLNEPFAIGEIAEF